MSLHAPRSRPWSSEERHQCDNPVLASISAIMCAAPDGLVDLPLVLLERCKPLSGLLIVRRAPLLVAPFLHGGRPSAASHHKRLAPSVLRLPSASSESAAAAAPVFGEPLHLPLHVVQPPQHDLLEARRRSSGRTATATGALGDARQHTARGGGLGTVTHQRHADTAGLAAQRPSTLRRPQRLAVEGLSAAARAEGHSRGATVSLSSGHTPWACTAPRCPDLVVLVTALISSSSSPARLGSKASARLRWLKRLRPPMLCTGGRRSPSPSSVAATCPLLLLCCVCSCLPISRRTSSWVSQPQTDASEGLRQTPEQPCRTARTSCIAYHDTLVRGQRARA